MNDQLKSKRISLSFVFAIWFIGTGFSQNTLEFYLKAAQKNSPVIKENLSIKAKSLIQGKKIESEYGGPKIYASGELNYSPLLPNMDNPHPFGYDAAITNGGLIAANINVLQPVLNNAVRQSLVRQNEAVAESGIVQSELNLHRIEKEVTDQYIIACLSLSQLEYAKNIREQIQKQKMAVESLAASGIYKTSDILLLDIEIQNQTAQINNLLSAYNQNLYSLCSLCGINAAPNTILVAPELKIKNDVSESGFLKKFSSDSLNEALRIEVLNLKYKPQFNLYGNTGLMSTGFSDIQRKFGVAAGLTMLIPIYDGHQKKYNQDESQINLQNIDNYKQNFIIQKKNHQQVIMTNLGLIDQRIEVIGLQLKNYDKLIALYKSELQAGTLEVINYMNTIRSYISLQNDLLVNKTNKLLIINENNYYNW